ncbi:hypothetical protein NDU88_001127 [Pleurodeles waltl]|uniref:Uncharacterized protein n=1 Tax=Pleurodeles waltl TaxID=8319 RepID=A0AAV7LA41_PLEWA|nr:hypothetical protein NDU88_001127 [Pleurodeles waltl]
MHCGVPTLSHSFLAPVPLKLDLVWHPGDSGRLPRREQREKYPVTVFAAPCSASAAPGAFPQETLKREIRGSRSQAPNPLHEGERRESSPSPPCRSSRRPGGGRGNKHTRIRQGKLPQLSRVSRAQTPKPEREGEMRKILTLAPLSFKPSPGGDKQTWIRREETSAAFPSRDRGKVCSQCKTRDFGVTSVRREFTAAR